MKGFRGIPMLMTKPYSPIRYAALLLSALFCCSALIKRCNYRIQRHSCFPYANHTIIGRQWWLFSDNRQHNITFPTLLAD